jgi:phosphoenolpyruvate carboxylase
VPILRAFHRDYLDLADALREHRRRARDAGEEPIAVDAASRDRMHTLHALRLALIQRLFLLAVRVSDFSPRHGVTREDLVTLIMHLDVEPALAQLAEIFPVTEAGAGEDGFDEPATYRSAESQSYVHEHEEIFRPMGRLYELIRRVGSGVIHHVGAIG